MKSQLPLIFALLTVVTGRSQPVQVTTSKGIVSGLKGNFTSPGNPYYRGVGEYYLGIPFATPPIDELRFKPPEDPIPWVGESLPLQTKTFRPKCPQPRNVWLPPPGDMSEDCLYLNVFTPDSSAKGKYPVMFWIHGGGFTIGGSQDFFTAGIISNLVRHGVVVVTTNYRLGLLGFFTTLTSKFPGNLGMLDQVKAMQWIADEIHNFGGNANHVTLFGESAGGCSVALHSVSPLSRHLFSKAILQSGTSQMPICVNGLDYDRYPSRNAAMKLCNITQKQWDAQQFDILDTCLRTMSWEQIVASQTGYEIVGFEVWPPVVDGEGGFLPDWPKNLIKNRRDMPVLIGTTKDEFVASHVYKLMNKLTSLNNYTEETYMQALNQTVTEMEFGVKVGEIRKMVDAKYRLAESPPIQPDDHLKWLRTITLLHNEKYMFAPTVAELKDFLQTNTRSNVYLYSFDYASPGRRSIQPMDYPFVPHTEDIFFVFDTPIFMPGPTADDLRVIDAVGEFWASFAKNGKPSIGGDTEVWLPTSLKNITYLQLDSKLTMKTDYQWEADKFWNKYIPSLLEAELRTSAGEKCSTLGTGIALALGVVVGKILFTIC